ncbi:MAG TPA: OmpA family protein [Polyangiaceae bacterium]|nr:OmpA family protein [Polyangiaceae bacterium]
MKSPNEVWVRTSLGAAVLKCSVPGVTNTSEQVRLNSQVAWDLVHLLNGAHGLDELRLARELESILPTGGLGPPSRAPSPRQVRLWLSGIAGRVADALRAGLLRVELVAPSREGVWHDRVERQSEPDPVPQRSAPPPRERVTTWFSLRIIDEVGAPVEGVSVKVSTQDGDQTLTTSSTGVVRLDDVSNSRSASARLVDQSQVRSVLSPRWREPRSRRNFGGSSVLIRSLAEAFLDPLELPSEIPTTLVLTPHFECREIPGAYFEFGRSFVRAEALEPLADIAEALRGDENLRALICGHTDISGSDALNKELSERRAKAVHALLTHDADAWEELFSGTADGSHWQERWGVKEAQHMLNALGVTDDSGAPLVEHGERDTATVQAIHRFQRGDYPDKPAEQAPLAESTTLGAEGRRELFLAYAKRVSRQPSARDRFTKVGSAPFMGCGEFNPVKATARDQESRRTVVFLFDPAAEPSGLPCQLRQLAPCKSNLEPASSTAQRERPYRCRIYQKVAERCPCQAGPDLSHDLVLRFPMTLASANTLPHRYILTSEDGTINQTRELASQARANEQQRAELTFEHLPDTHRYRLICDEPTSTYTLFELAALSELQERLATDGEVPEKDVPLELAGWFAEAEVDAPASDSQSAGDQTSLPPEDGASA